MRIYLVRHGQTTWNVQGRIQGSRGSRLTETGRKQAERVAQRFAKKRLDVIISSPTVRTMQTVRAINAYHALRIVKDERFRERGYGALEGLTHKQVHKLIPDVDAQWKVQGIDWRPPGGGETMREFQRRVMDTLGDTICAFAGETMLIVTHGGNMRAIAHFLHGGRPETVFDRKTPDNAELIQVEARSEKNRVCCRLVGKRPWKLLR